MSLQSIKHYNCAQCHGEGILLVDIETESFPHTDKDGNWQYYCMEGQHIFSVTERGKDTLAKAEEQRALEIFSRRH